jgi:hypothetical protein
VARIGNGRQVQNGMRKLPQNTRILCAYSSTAVNCDFSCQLALGLISDVSFMYANAIQLSHHQNSSKLPRPKRSTTPRSKSQMLVRTRLCIKIKTIDIPITPPQTNIVKPTNRQTMIQIIIIAFTSRRTLSVSMTEICFGVYKATFLPTHEYPF